MNTYRKANTTNTFSRTTAITAGVLYLVTHVTSIGAFILYYPILNNADYIIGSGSDNRIILGALFEIVLSLAIVGTAIVLFPVVKRWNEGIALGYVGLRILEAGVIAVGVVPLLAIVTLRSHLAGDADADTTTLIPLGRAFVGAYEWTTLIGPGLICGTNTVFMAYLMYVSRLVPRFIPVLGLVGGPLIFAVTTVRLFGIDEQYLAWTAIAVIPIFAWEVTLAIHLITRGFRASAHASEGTQLTTTTLRSAA